MAVVAQPCRDASRGTPAFPVCVLQTHRGGHTRSRRYDFDVQSLTLPESPYAFSEKPTHSPQLFQWLMLRLVLSFNLVLHSMKLRRTSWDFHVKGITGHLAIKNETSTKSVRKRKMWLHEKIHPVVEIRKICVLITQLIDPHNKNSKSEITVHKPQ